jgi:hypothetical protein
MAAAWVSSQAGSQGIFDEQCGNEADFLQIL